MQLLPKFWATLGSIPAWATDFRDWRLRLGDEFPWIEPFLRGTGQVARFIDCPAPGGDGCPRSVVRLPSGVLKGVCGCSPTTCDAVDLEPQDVVIAAVNHSALAQSLALALGAIPTPDRNGAPPRLIRLGSYSVAAGVSATVHLAASDPRDPITEQDLRLGGMGSEPVIIVLPDEAQIPSMLRSVLVDRGHLVILLPDAVAATASGKLIAVQPPEVLFRPVHEALIARLHRPESLLRFPQQPGTGWHNLTFALTSAETVVCSMPGGTRQIDPDDLGLRNNLNKRPKIAWTLLVSVIAEGGTLSLQLAGSVKKQKETLARAMQAAFGIDDDPLPARRFEGVYQAAFHCRDERTLGERRRNFDENSSEQRAK